MAGVRVVPYNETFYPALCRQGEGFTVLYRTRPIQAATFEILDPSGKHLLFRGPCAPGEPGVCQTTSFCPVQDVMVRVTSRNGAVGSALVMAGLESLQCPPTGEWVVAFMLQGPYGARFPGSTLRFDVRVLNAPDRLLAFKLSLQIRPAFGFLSFQTSLPVEQELSDGVLAISGDASGSIVVGGLLGRLDLRLDGEHAGLLRVLRVSPGGAQLMVGEGWFAVRVQGQGGSCLSNGFVDVLTDYPRCTGLFALPSRTQLVHWQGVQDAAVVFPGQMGVLGVWNTRRVDTVDAQCTSLSTGVLEVASCQRIVPRGPGSCMVVIRFQDQKLGAVVRVLQPENVRALLVGGGRMVVLGTLLGRVMDITPFVLANDEVVCPEGGNVTIGQPVLLHLQCDPSGAGTPDSLFLLAGNWTRRGGFRLRPSLLSSGNDRAGALFFRGDEIVPYPVTSEDPSRVQTDGRWLRLVQQGESPRCVRISGGWKIPVLPASPAALELELSRTVLVVQQDLSKLVPSRAELLAGRLVLSDGSGVDVLDRLGLTVSPGLRMGRGWLETLYEPGRANATFHLPGAPCVTRTLDVTVYSSSVVSAELVCPRCPSMLATRVDPLSQRWPTRFPSSVPVSWFIVRRLLVDGSTHDGLELLQVSGAGVLEGEFVVGVVGGTVSVSTAFTQASVEVLVIERWATSWRLLCNQRVCDPGVKLAPAGDGAGMAPFRYVTVLELAVELTLYNGTVLVMPDPPDTALLVNGERKSFPEIPLQQGPLIIRVVFGAGWAFTLSENTVGMEVHALASLKLSVPPVLRQIHCTRVWERGELSLQAVLTDGARASVQGAVTTDGTFLRLDRTGIYVEALWPGRAWVNASYGHSSVSVDVLVTMESLVFTGLSLDAVPGVWAAPLLARLPMHSTLEPAVFTGDSKHLLAKVVRWQTEPVGVLDVLPSGDLSLLSDHYEPVLLTGVIRSCQGALPLVFSKSIQVNVVADRPWQVDFGQDGEGSPLPAVPVGGQLAVPVFLFCASPLTLFRAVVSLPGLDLAPVCTPGELPLSQCVVREGGSGVELSGNFPASRRTGRLLLGSFQGTVLLNGLSRLRVSLAEPGNTTYEFTVRLGVGSVHSVLSRINAVTAGFSDPGPVDWQKQAPTDLRVCCDVLATGAGSAIAHLVPSSFSLRNITLYPGGALLALTDPRLLVEYDRLLLDFDVRTETWTVRRLVPSFEDTTQILLDYLHPGSSESLQATVVVSLTEPYELVVSPVELSLKRIHCSVRFQAKPVVVKLVLREGTVIPLSGRDIENASAGDPSLASVSVQADRLLVAGLATGNTTLLVTAFHLKAVVSIVVLDESVLLHSVRVPDPYVLESPRGRPVPLNMSGTLEDGEDMPYASFLVETVTPSRPVAEWHADQGLSPLKNTHPGQQHTVVVVVPACSSGSAFAVTSSLLVRLRADRLPDVVVDPGPASFKLTLVAESVQAFVITLHTDSPGAVCIPGPDLPSFADCSVDAGTIVLAGCFREPRPGPAYLAVILPMPSQISGYVEVFSGLTGTTRTEIEAGRFGSGPGSLPTTLPAADPATLAREYMVALARPWDEEALQKANLTLLVLTGRQRLVLPWLYSNDMELSAMFQVTDRFLIPDQDKTTVDVVFYSQELPPHPDATSHPCGVKVRAQHVLLGWYMVEWTVPIPHLELRVAYEVSTSTSLSPLKRGVREPLVTGRPLHDCPRLATDRAIFRISYRVPAPLPVDWTEARIACAARVPVRRVSIQQRTGGDDDGVAIVSLAVESFIRCAEADMAIDMLHPDNNRSGGRRLLQAISNVQPAGVEFIDDPPDPRVPCPPGTYYTRNGTYERLPLHAVLGPDCYGMACMDGYLLTGSECVPVPVSTELVWVSVCVILSFVLLLSCVLCALYLGRRAPSSQQETVDLVSESWPGSSHPSEPFVEDDQEFKNIVLGSYLDDYSKDMLDDDFNPAGSPLQQASSCRLARA